MIFDQIIEKPLQVIAFLRPGTASLTLSACSWYNWPSRHWHWMDIIWYMAFYGPKWRRVFTVAAFDSDFFLPHAFLSSSCFRFHSLPKANKNIKIVIINGPSSRGRFRGNIRSLKIKKHFIQPQSFSQFFVLLNRLKSIKLYRLLMQVVSIKI